MQCVKTKVAKLLYVDPELLNGEALKIKKDILDNVWYFDKMIELLVVKVKTVELTKIKIQILTLTPTDWSHKKIMDFWCFRIHCMQGTQIVFGKRYFSWARTKKGQVFAC